MHVASFALLYSHSPTRGTLRRLTGCTYEVLPVANSPSRLEVAQIVCETHVRSTWQIVGAGRRNTHGLTLANMQNWQQAHQHYLPDLRNIIAVEGAHVTDPGSQFNKANNINTHTHTHAAACKGNTRLRHKTWGTDRKSIISPATGLCNTAHLHTFPALPMSKALKSFLVSASLLANYGKSSGRTPALV